MAIKTTPTVAALDAQGAANPFLSDRLGDHFLAVCPLLDEGGDVWRVPVVMTYPVLVGPLGEVGEVLVSAGAEEVVSHSCSRQSSTTGWAARHNLVILVER